MNKKNTIELSETVILIDAAYLNAMVSELKSHFERVLKRSLPEVDLSALMIYLTLDAGIRKGDNKIQTLFVYDQDSENLRHCHPSGLREELNGTAFKCDFGEYLFASVPSEEMVSREELFIDLLSIITDSADVKQIGVLSSNDEYGKRVIELLNGVKNKEVIQFRMDKPETAVEYRWDMLPFSIMRALGIKGEDLDA